MDGRLAEVALSGLRVGGLALGATLADLLESLLGRHGLYALDERLGREPRVGDHRHAEGVVAPDGVRIEPDAHDVRPFGIGLSPRHGAAALVVAAEIQHDVRSSRRAAVERMAAREDVVARKAAFADREREQLGQLDRGRLAAALRDFGLQHHHRLLRLEQHLRHGIDLIRVGRDFVRDHEVLAVVDRPAHVLRLEHVVGVGEVDGSRRVRRGDLKRAAKRRRDGARAVTLPGDFRELSVDLFLIEARARREQDVIAEDLVIEQAGRHDQRRAVSAGVVELPRGLRGAGDDVQVHEGGLVAHLVVAVGHRDDDALRGGRG